MKISVKRQTTQVLNVNVPHFAKDRFSNIHYAILENGNVLSVFKNSIFVSEKEIGYKAGYDDVVLNILENCEVITKEVFYENLELSLNRLTELVKADNLLS